MRVEPTVHQRAPMLDVARGVAILGILLANIAAFVAPTSEFILPTPPATLVHAWVDALTVAFVSGKFRGMLAILFGIGLYLQFRKRTNADQKWPGLYLRRALFLGLFGAVHYFAFWYGDILFTYAITALIVVWLVRLSDEVLGRVVGICFGLSALMGIGLAGLFAVLPMIPEFSEDFGAMMREEAVRETAIFAQGSYLQMLQFRAQWAGNLIGQALFFQVSLVPLFLVGIWLARTRILLAPSEQPELRDRILRWSLGVGLPLNLVALALVPTPYVAAYQLAVEFGFGAFLSVGYLMLIAIAVEKLRTGRLLQPVANMGKLALTSYLGQTIMATGYFYSWGTGSFGAVPLATQYAVVVCVWAINLVFASVWLRFFDIGPMEWVLRSLSEKRRLPWRYPQVIEKPRELEPERAVGFQL